MGQTKNDGYPGVLKSESDDIMISVNGACMTME